MGRPRKLVNLEDVKKLEVEMTVEPEIENPLEEMNKVEVLAQGRYETALAKEHVCSETLVSCLTDENVTVLEDMMFIWQQLYRTSNSVSFRTKVQLYRKILAEICDRHKQLQK